MVRVFAVVHPYVMLAVVLCCWLSPAIGQNPIAEADLRHGSSQLKQLLVDRPEMRAVLPAGSAVDGWLERAFASTDGRRVYWDNRQPVSGRGGEHTLPMNDYPTSVRLTQNATPLDKYTILIFEFHNARRVRERMELLDLAVTGAVNEQDFAERWATGEFYAMLETQAFLKTHSFSGLATDVDSHTKAFLNTKNDLNAYLSNLRSQPVDGINVLEIYKKLFRSTTGQKAPEDIRGVSRQ